MSDSLAGLLRNRTSKAGDERSGDSDPLVAGTRSIEPRSRGRLLSGHTFFAGADCQRTAAAAVTSGSFQFSMREPGPVLRWLVR